MPDLLYDKSDGVATITLNRPERRNAYSPELMCRLADAWTDVRDDDAIRVAILTGAGEKAFTSGGDLGLLIPLFTGAREPENEWDERLKSDLGIMNTVLLKDFDIGKPIIAAVNGAALAGGTEIMLACDIRVAVPDATFGLPEPKRGLVPGGGSMVRLARQIGFAPAMEMMLTGDAYSAEYALSVGLINRIVERPELLVEARRLAAIIAENAPLAVQAIKRTVTETSGRSLEEAFPIEANLSGPVMRSEDAREGPKAFLEKRPPVFKGR